MTALKPIRVLLAEDSELFAETLVEVLEQDRTFEVFGVARDGDAALRMTELGKPDVVLMNVRMKGAEGLTAIERIMDRCPTPILVMTADPTGKTNELSFEALRRGALDLVPRPTTWAGTPAEQEDLRSRLFSLSRIRVVRRRADSSERLQPDLPVRARPSAGAVMRAVGLVASTGGPPVLARILHALPVNFPSCILIVQHLSDDFCGRFASWLGQNTALRVELAREGRALEPGLVLVAPGGTHLSLDGQQSVRLNGAPALAGHRPSGTILLRAVARAFGSYAVGGVLTGMGTDGAEGLLEVQRAHGLTFVQHPDSCVVAGMPTAALALTRSARSLTTDAIARELLGLGRPAPEAAP